jgi:hypothetical protein
MGVGDAVRRVIAFVVIFVSAVLTSQFAFASGPEPDEIPRRPGWHDPRVLTPTPSPTAIPIVANTRRGTSPDDALDITGEWHTVEPGASVWYKTTDAAGFRMIEMWLEANPQDSAELAIYSPDQNDLSFDTKPIGRGSKTKIDPPNVLHWKAGYARWGTWYAIVTNRSNTSSSYSLRMNQEARDAKNCVGYWEYIGADYVYWVACDK